MRCIKDVHGKILTKEPKIKKRWQSYFSKLLNDEVLGDFWSREQKTSERQLDPRLCEPISKDEIRETLKKMANEKVEGPDQISVEVYKCLDEEGLEWLIELCNVIFRTVKMPRE